MRIGINPNKDKARQSNDFFHQVIIPVYIPNSEGYFKNSFTILQYCLNSLFLTSHNKTYYTIINNGSSPEVVSYLNKLFAENKIHEVIHADNIGKPNAILKGIIGHDFPLITISDADVLFINDWQKETYNVFETFPKAGAVSTTPNSKSLCYLTSNLLFDTFFSKKVKFTKVKNPQAMIDFAESINNDELFNEINLKKYLTITDQNVSAVFGSGHFVATYRSDIFNTFNQKFAKYNLGGTSLIYYFDYPVVKNGYWRLATEDNFTYHLGNTPEKWMEEKINNLKQMDLIFDSIPTLKELKKNQFSIWFKNKVFKKIIFNKHIWKFYMRNKGLNMEEANRY